MLTAGKKNADTVLNVYGDHASFTQDGHGNDIAAQRCDDLDAMALDHLCDLLSQRQQPLPQALDVGCGLGGQSLRMAVLGAMVQAVDIEDRAEGIRTSCDVLQVPRACVRFARMGLEGISSLDGSFDVIVCQRMIHYVRWQVALQGLKDLARKARPKARLYLSASGLPSELAQGYLDADRPVEERFAFLSIPMADKHHIYHPVCLYAQDELVALAELAGWKVERAFVSAFGNIKLCASKP